MAAEQVWGPGVGQMWGWGRQVWAGMGAGAKPEVLHPQVAGGVWGRRVDRAGVGAGARPELIPV